MNNYINNLFINAIGAPDPETIQVYFYHRPDPVEYPAHLMALLENDRQVRDIVDPATGEVLFTHDNL